MSRVLRAICRCVGCPILVWAVTMMLNASMLVSLRADETFPQIFNTEAAGQAPPAAEEMVGLLKLPDGFSATLFAGEPDVQQPICMDFDDRGRLWVAECYTYSGGPYETKLQDRVIILEDTDHDGRHDTRKVFWDQGFMLTSLAYGFGGLWVLHDGTLSFIPDRDGDDVPDGEPEVKLDGWSKECGHNFVSGLMWGPDGWLYGRHGIVDTSYPGAPGTPQDQRPAMNCGIWRYHPQTHIVESVCYGTTNPWGLDYDARGHFFMTNNVQGHLWHVLPGAHFKRMYGQDFNPHFYELMDMSADHYHWDTNGKWNESRDGVANDLGGGHSHVGGLIYQGTNFPAQYRGRIFMCNTHGRRINVDRLERSGSGFVGRHEPDFMLVGTPWFRGVDIKVGPDGTMYVADWSDNGECHDHDGIHRTSGRIYRIAYGQPVAYQPSPPLVDNTTGALLQLTKSDNSWLARHALRILQERGADGQIIQEEMMPDGSFLPVLAREALGLNEIYKLKTALQPDRDVDELEHAVQLAGETAERREKTLPNLKRLARGAPPANVLMSLISVLRRFELSDRRELALEILAEPKNATRIAADEKLTLMAWYGLEPLVRSVDFARQLKPVPRVQQFAVRRLAFEIDSQPELLSEILAMISDELTSGQESSVAAQLHSLRQGLSGRVRVAAPKNWAQLSQQLRTAKSAQIQLSIDTLSVLFGDGAALSDLRSLAIDGNRDVAARESAIAALAQARDSQSIPNLYQLLTDRAVADAAIRALASFDHSDTPKQLLGKYGGFKDGNRSLAIDTLSSRTEYALELMQAIESDQIDARDLSAAQVRQLLALGNDRIRQVLEAKWGVLHDTPTEKEAAIEKWRTHLTEDELGQANLAKGAELFKKSCANCHRLYGEGQTIGPDLTGSNRGSLDYVLMNVIDPSSIVPKQFTTSIVVMTSGRVITGVIIGQTESTLTIQTDKELLSLQRAEIEEIQGSSKSLMPDGLLDTLSTDQVRDLIGFIMHRK